MPRTSLIPLTLATLSLNAAAQTVTVTTVEDVVDVSATATVADLPGPDGLLSFREALLATNNTPGPQTVEFAIPQNDWWLFPGYAALKLEQGLFVVQDDGTTLDFSSQTAFTGDTNPSGNEVGVYGLQVNGWGTPAILITASDCVVRGLGPVSQRSAAVWIGGGSRNRILGCVTSVVEIDPYPGTTQDNVVGGVAPGEGNVLESVLIHCGANDNLVIGNTLESVAVVGSQYCDQQYPERNRVGGPSPAERNVFSGAGSYGSEGFPTGQNVRVEWARGTIIEGNYVGVTPDGLQRVPQVGPIGIYVVDSIDTLVRDNLVAGMRVVGINHYAGDVFGEGVVVSALNADNVGVVLEGNKVGTDVSGELPIQTHGGIRIAPATGLRKVKDVRVGGTLPGQANRIAFTEGTGIAVLTGAQARLSGNSIEGNALLGIDLGTFFQGVDGVTPNDLGDADLQGGNALQNHPLLQAAFAADAILKLSGVLESRPNSDYALEFFSSPACDPTGFGEGAQYLGSSSVTTDLSGRSSFRISLQATVPIGHVVSATATDEATGETSEFGSCVVTRGLHAAPGLNAH